MSDFGSEVLSDNESVAKERINMGFGRWTCDTDTFEG